MRDVIVVGAGAGGPVVAKELAARGLDVLMLEGGRGTSSPERDWTHLENDMNNPITGMLRYGPGDRSKPWWFRELPQSSFLTQVAGVGGTTQHYYGNSPRAMPGVFAGYDGPDAGAYDRAHQFPLTYQELLPYYEWVEATLPVMTAAMGTKERRFFDGCEGVGLPVLRQKDIDRDSFRPQENAILQPEGTAGTTTDSGQLTYPNARGCTFCGFCLQGCYTPLDSPRNQNAKRSTDTSYAPMAVSADHWAPGGRAATLITDAYVTRVHTSPGSNGEVARAVTWRDVDTGEQHTEEAHVIVLAAGCVETPRLWFNSRLPDPNGWVGRGLTDHAFDWVIGVFDEYTGSSKGAASAARADFPGRGGLENVGTTPGFNALLTNLSDSGIAGQYDRGRSGVHVEDVDRGRMVGNELRAAMGDVDHLLNVLVMTDDDVERDNQVSLSLFPADEHGAVPKVIMGKRERSQRTRENRDFLAGRAVDVLRAAGARRILRVDFSPLLLHLQSSMRMGADPANSVVDEHAQSRAVERLYVADASMLANALGGPNPALTTQALATRTAEHIFATHFDGDPWVHEESPVASNSDEVTQAVIDSGYGQRTAREESEAQERDRPRLLDLFRR